MKINQWIVFGLLFSVCAASRGLGAEVSSDAINEAFGPFEKSLQSTVTAIENSADGHFHWVELENFHQSLWRAMALDPVSGGDGVPSSEVPKTLWGSVLTAELAKNLDALKKSTVPHDLNAEAEFKLYTETVDSIMLERKDREYGEGRNIAKRGKLDDTYQMLSTKISSQKPTAAHQTPVMIALEAFNVAIKNLKETLSDHDQNPFDFFATKNHFLWLLATLLAGFTLGMVIHHRLTTAAPTTTTTGTVQRLDYARWLQEFEEILVRLKSSQSAHERKIGELIKNSEKVTEIFSELASDQDLKKVLYAHHHFSERLQNGNASEINAILEHCVRLLDAVETESVELNIAQNSASDHAEEQHEPHSLSA